MNFAQRLREVRATKGLTQQQIADKLNVSKSIVAHWEAGRRTPPMSTMSTISEVLGVSVNYLVGDSTEAIAYDSSMNEIAREIMDKPELRMLFNVAINSKKEDILMCTNLLERVQNL